jgi:hypothetical protein
MAGVVQRKIDIHRSRKNLAMTHVFYNRSLVYSEKTRNNNEEPATDGYLITTHTTNITPRPRLERR